MRTETQSRRVESPAETIDRWIAGSVKGVRHDEPVSAGWEPGQAGYVTVGGCNYEKFAVGGGGYVVIEWDGDGNVCVM